MITIKITCDAPVNESFSDAHPHAEERCHSATGDGFTARFENVAPHINVLPDAMKIAFGSGWEVKGRKFYCPGCVQRMRNAEI